MVSSKTVWQNFRSPVAGGSSIEGVDSSGQLAAGVVIGTLIGLIPKDSALLILFITLAILSNVNLLTTLLGALIFFLVESMEAIQRFSHSIGAAVFQTESLQPYLTALFSIPGVAWLRLENSIVCGSFILGLMLVVPMYLISHRIFERSRSRFIKLAEQWKFFRWRGPRSSADIVRGD